MATKIVTKNSSTAGAAPTATDLVQGELAVNVADGRLYTEDNAAAIVELGVNPATEITANAGIALPDSQKATFGAGDDLQIYHDGSSSFIKDAGTGNLIIQATDLQIANADNTANYIRAFNGGAVDLRYAGSAKLATTSTGIDVTGTATTDGVLSNGGGINDIPLEITHSWGASGTPLIKASNASSEVFRVQRNGSVGIGTSSPSSALHAKGGSITTPADSSAFLTNATARLVVNHGNEYGAYVGYLNSANDAIGIQSARATGQTGPLSLNPYGGSVGIGTSSPDTLVQATNTSASTNYISYEIGNSGISSANKGGFAIYELGSLATSITYARDGTGHTDFNADTLVFNNAANNTERMRIDSSGNVGIGGTPTAPLHVFGGGILGASSTNPIAFTGSSGANAGIGSYNANTDFNVYAAGTGVIKFRNAATWNSSGQLTSVGTERMRIDSSGNLLVGQSATTVPGVGNTTAGSAIGSAGYIFVSKSGDTPAHFNRNTNDGDIITLRKNGTTVGSISVTASATTYNTSSDQRLKENIADADDAGSKIDAIQVRKYDWKADGSHQDYGMIAQELQAVAPEAVSGDADSEEMMGVDYSKLVPMLIKEIQSLRNRVAQLETGE